MPVEAFAALSSESREKIAKVKLLILDVDGVLTDGGLYYGPDGTVTKRFDVQDGLGISLARHFDLRIAVITGQDQPSVTARLRDLKVDDYFAGYIDKRESCAVVCERHGLCRDEVAFLGDDWIDIPVMRSIGAPLAVANARPETKKEALYVTHASGGRGAVREAIRLVFYCKNQLDQVFSAWMERYSE
ncbi:MAG: 3-deoxy-D-manno-octulosonate 8-phosphate phosphatase KdsC [Desulfovibrio sp.]